MIPDIINKILTPIISNTLKILNSKLSWLKSIPSFCMLWNAIETKRENMVIATMSSKLAEASIIIGIPFLVPHFNWIKIMTDGTRIAGLTAPKKNPFAKLRLQGIPNI